MTCETYGENFLSIKASKLIPFYRVVLLLCFVAFNVLMFELYVYVIFDHPWFYNKGHFISIIFIWYLQVFAFW